jgi:hypothetical protein
MCSPYGLHEGCYWLLRAFVRHYFLLRTSNATVHSIHSFRSSISLAHHSSAWYNNQSTCMHHDGDDSINVVVTSANDATWAYFSLLTATAHKHIATTHHLYTPLRMPLPSSVPMTIIGSIDEYIPSSCACM